MTPQKIMLHTYWDHPGRCGRIGYMMKHDACDHPRTPAARRACRAQHAVPTTVRPRAQKVSVPEVSLEDRVRDIFRAQVAGVVTSADDAPSWLSTEGVILNGGLRPPGQEHLSSSTGSRKKNHKQRKESLLVDRPASEGFFLYEDNTYRVIRSKSNDNLYARLITPDNPTYGEYAPGIIKSLKESMRVEEPAAVAEVRRESRLENPVRSPGFYELDGNIYKVKQSRSSGRLYALLVTENDTRGTFAPGIIFKLSADDVLTEERAAAFGQVTGQCLICNRTLTVQESIDRGIGPVCAEKMGW